MQAELKIYAPDHVVIGTFYNQLRTLRYQMWLNVRRVCRDSSIITNGESTADGLIGERNDVEDRLNITNGSIASDQGR